MGILNNQKEQKELGFFLNKLFLNCGNINFWPLNNWIFLVN